MTDDGIVLVCCHSRNYPHYSPTCADVALGMTEHTVYVRFESGSDFGGHWNQYERVVVMAQSQEDAYDMAADHFGGGGRVFDFVDADDVFDDAQHLMKVAERVRLGREPYDVAMDDFGSDPDPVWAMFCNQWLLVGLAASPLADVYLAPSQRGGR